MNYDLVVITILKQSKRPGLYVAGDLDRYLFKSEWTNEWTK